MNKGLTVMGLPATVCESHVREHVAERGDASAKRPGRASEGSPAPLTNASALEPEAATPTDAGAPGLDLVRGVADSL